MLGSSASVSTPNIVLNTAVAEALAQFYEELSGTEPENMEHAVHELLKRAIRKHKKVIFNGNGYSSEWISEAKKRGLYNLVSTPECLPYFTTDRSVELFTKHHIFTKEEIFSRYEILLENYAKTIGIEARTMIEMLTKDFLPAVSLYSGQTARNAASKKTLLPGLSTVSEETLVNKLTDAYTKISEGTEELKELTEKAASMEQMQQAADFCQKELLTKMQQIRQIVDETEALLPDSVLPYPTYDQLLFSI